MTAETAYNVAKALPQSEYDRLLKMLGMQETPTPKRELITKSQAHEQIAVILERRQRLNNNK